MSTLLQDFRYVWRQIYKNTGGPARRGSFASNAFTATGLTSIQDISVPTSNKRLMEHGAILRFDQEFRQNFAPPGSR